MVFEIACAYYNTVLVRKSHFLWNICYYFVFGQKHLHRDKTLQFTTIDICIIFHTFQDFHYPYDCRQLWIEQISTGRHVIYRENRQRSYFSRHVIYFTIRTVRISTYYYQRLSTFFFRCDESPKLPFMLGKKREHLFGHKDVQRLTPRGISWRTRTFYIFCIPIFSNVSSHDRYTRIILVHV